MTRILHLLLCLLLLVPLAYAAEAPDSEEAAPASIPPEEEESGDSDGSDETGNADDSGEAGEASDESEESDADAEADPNDETYEEEEIDPDTAESTETTQAEESEESGEGSSEGVEGKIEAEEETEEEAAEDPDEKTAGEKEEALPYAKGIEVLAGVALPDLSNAAPMTLRLIIRTPDEQSIKQTDQALYFLLADGQTREVISQKGRRYRLPKEITFHGYHLEIRLTPRTLTDDSKVKIPTKPPRSGRRPKDPGFLVNAAVLWRAGRHREASAGVYRLLKHRGLSPSMQRRLVLWSSASLAWAALEAQGEQAVERMDIQAFGRAQDRLLPVYAPQIKSEVKLPVSAFVRRTSAMIAAGEQPDLLETIKDTKERERMRKLFAETAPSVLFRYGLSHRRYPPLLEAVMAHIATQGAGADSITDQIAADPVAHMDNLLLFWEDATPIPMLAPPVADARLRRACGFSIAYSRSGWCRLPATRADLVRLLLLPALPIGATEGLADDKVSLRIWLADYAKMSHFERLQSLYKGGSQLQRTEALAKMYAAKPKETFQMLQGEMRQLDEWEATRHLHSMLNESPKIGVRLARAYIVENKDSMQSWQLREIKQSIANIHLSPNLKRLFEYFDAALSEGADEQRSPLRDVLRAASVEAPWPPLEGASRRNVRGGNREELIGIGEDF